MITFGSCFPGRIVPIEIGSNKSWVLQKRSFLAAESGVELSVHFNRKAKTGIFGGEGFVMQKLTGSGIAFAEIDGDLVEYQLAPGQQMIVDTGNVAGFEDGQNRCANGQGRQEHCLWRRGPVQHRAYGPGPYLVANDARYQSCGGYRVDGL